MSHTFVVLFLHLNLHLPTDRPLQVKINTGVDTPERATPGYLNNLDLGEAVAALVEARNSSHSVFTVSSPADLKTVLLERNL